MKWDRACFCSWFDADEVYGWVWIGLTAGTIFGLGQKHGCGQTKTKKKMKTKIK